MHERNIALKYLPITLILALALFANVAFAAETQTEKAGKYTVELATQPTPPTVGENQVTITVMDGDKPVTGAGVSLHVDMVEMSMPIDVKATPGAQDGQYVATVNLGMAGEWKITADVQGMAGMAMPGDGKATFSVTAQQATAGGASASSTPMEPAAPASIPWPLIFGAVAVAGVVVGILIARGRSKQTPGA